LIIKKALFIILAAALFIISGCSNSRVPLGAAEPPNATGAIDGREIKLSRGSYRWEHKGLFSTTATIADAASPFQIAEELKPISVIQGAPAEIQFSDKSEPQLTAYLWKEDARRKELAIDEKQLMLPSEAGEYVIEIWAEWPNGNASYTFVVEVEVTKD
jgi:hypothetical protein